MRNLLGHAAAVDRRADARAGDELGRTQRGNNNAYCQDNEISWVDWDHGRQPDLLGVHARRSSRCAAAHRCCGSDAFFDGRPARADGMKDLAWFAPTGTR